MSDKFSFRGGDTEGVADGDYALTVSGGHVTGLSPAGGGSGVVETIVPGTGIAVDDTDPANPVVSATGGGGGGGGGGAVPMGSTISHFDFFGPESRGAEALTGTSTGGYVWPGDALTSSQHAFRFDLGIRRAARVNWRVVWVPKAAGNGLRLVHAENGPTNITQLAAFTGYTQTTPIVTEQELTTEFNALVDAGVWKNFGHQINAGSTGPTIHLSRLEVIWEGGTTAAPSTYREVLMASGVTPPEPLESSDGGDWLYGEVQS